MNYKSRIPATIMAVLTRTMTHTFLICALCSLAIVAPAWSANADQPIPVAVYDNFSLISATGSDSTWEGKFTSIIGTEVATGTSRMDVHVTGDIAHCKFTWVRSDGQGTLVVLSVCVLSSGHGTWHVDSGTGAYKNFKAVGTETFGLLADVDSPPYVGPFTRFERFAGIGTDGEHGGNEHGGNQ
jgi:hypothetical protein